MSWRGFRKLTHGMVACDALSLVADLFKLFAHRRAVLAELAVAESDTFALFAAQQESQLPSVVGWNVGGC